MKDKSQTGLGEQCPGCNRMRKSLPHIRNGKWICEDCNIKKANEGFPFWEGKHKINDR